MASTDTDTATAAFPGIRPTTWLIWRGIAAILFGVIALAVPMATVAALVLFMASFWLVDGVIALVGGIRAGRAGSPWGAMVLGGVADIACAAMAFFWPGITLVALVWIAGAFAIVSGAVMAWRAFQDKTAQARGWRLAGGIASVIWGALIFFQPVVGALVMTIWLGAWALAFGIMLLVIAFQLRKRGKV